MSHSARDFPTLCAHMSPLPVILASVYHRNCWENVVRDQTWPDIDHLRIPRTWEGELGSGESGCSNNPAGGLRRSDTLPGRRAWCKKKTSWWVRRWPSRSYQAQSCSSVLTFKILTCSRGSMMFLWSIHHDVQLDTDSIQRHRLGTSSGHDGWWMMYPYVFHFPFQTVPNAWMVVVHRLFVSV